MVVYDESSSDEDERGNVIQLAAAHFHEIKSSEGKHVGSSLGRRYIFSDRVSDNERLCRDYFSSNPIYPSNLFQIMF